MICLLWGRDVVSPRSGMAPRRPGACCRTGCWEHWRAPSRLRHMGSGSRRELSAVRTALKSSASSLCANRTRVILQGWEGQQWKPVLRLHGFASPSQ